MEEKLLTIVIPTYNMEKYLGRCIDSITNTKVNNLLDIIIINDGSTDKSLEIANSYSTKYQGIITVINKENGNYGSCINAALKVARGKYIKVLDADDWFDRQSFDSYLHKLQDIDADMIITNVCWIYANKRKIKQDFDLQENQIYNLGIFKDHKVADIQMHSITYRLSILKQCNYKQQEGISYTDQEWCFWPIIEVKHISFINEEVYQYWCGRGGQTMDPQILLKRYPDNIKGLKWMMNIYKMYSGSIEKNIELKLYLFRRLWNRSIFLYKIFLFHPKQFDCEFKKLDSFIKKENKELYLSLENQRYFLSPLIKRWRINHHYPTKLFICLWRLGRIIKGKNYF